MSEDKKLGILKVAKELNIGIGTIAEFLGTQGFKVEAKPNTKLTEQMYSALLKEYQGDKILKEEAKNIVIGKIRREDAAPQIEDIPQSRAVKEEEEEILIKNVSSAGLSMPDVSDKPSQEAPKKEEAAPSGVKIVGKIDLDSLNPKTRPDKKQREEPKPAVVPAPEVKAEEAKPEPKQEEKPVVKVEEAPKPEVKEEPKKEEAPQQAPEKKAEEPVEEKIEKPAVAVSEPKETVESPATEDIASEKPDDEVIRARAQQLSGPKIIGKIQLPVNKKKEQPVASSSNPNTADNKRKRKRKPFSAGGGTAQPGDAQNRQQPGQQGGGNRPQGAGGFNRNDRGPGRTPHKRGAHQASAPKAEPTEKEIQDQIKATLARLSGAGKSSKFAQRSKLRGQKRERASASAEEAALERELQSKILKVTEFVTANELANMMDVPVTDVISTCMSLGMFVSINQRLDAEALTIVADEFGYEIQFVGTEEEEYNLDEEDAEEDLISRAPIVTVMGHVDHGKTSLLDFVRKANVTSGEAGGITQHIGAYEVVVQEGKKITFLDTPGHEAFTAMRARGAKITDVAIIVIAADDSVMPQTVEAINHAQAANLPIVFAFNKIDKPGANTDRIREQLAAMNILVEDWGGKYQSQEIAAKSGLNVDKLLE
ncbi:GTP-binding protein, partial [Pseudoxanthomonas sp. SGD-10]